MAARLVWGSVRCAASRPSQNYVFTFPQDKPQEAQGQVTHAGMQMGCNVLCPEPLLFCSYLEAVLQLSAACPFALC